MAIGVVVLALVAGGSARALESEAFVTRLAEVSGNPDRAAALRVMEAMEAEALQAGRLDLRVQATLAHTRLRIRQAEFSKVREDLEEARSEARLGGWSVLEAEVCEVMAEYWLAQGDALSGAAWLDIAWSAALAGARPDTALAVRVLDRLAEARTSLGQDHLASQANAWHALLTGAEDAPASEMMLEPSALTTQVAADEIGRARLVVANATPAPLTGTLLIDGGDLVVTKWASVGSEERMTLQFPAATSTVPQSSAQGRKVTLLPGESRSVVLEVEPNSPPRPGVKSVSIVWQSGSTSLESTAEFHFRRERELPGTSVAHSCQVRLSPLVTVPVFMELYHRGRPVRHIQDLLPVTSQPCRVELQEILNDGSAGRQWLAVDVDGDGRYNTEGDEVIVDADGSGYPDVAFGESKEVAAIEARLYPLAGTDGALPRAFDLTLSLRDGGFWREPADVRHSLELAPH